MHALVYIFPYGACLDNSPMGDIQCIRVEGGDIQGDQPGQVFSGKAISLCSLHAEKVSGISSTGGDGFNQGIRMGWPFPQTSS